MTRPRWFAWWYLAIGVGYLLLAAHRLVIGDRSWLVGLRVAISVGFVALAWNEFRSRDM